ncbi:MAG: 2-C-methyl-D-erythritol 2,4-cyclodiphosphate synthase [Pseudomonadota bacterium]
MRIGYGVDLHKFAKNRKLILGGLEISHEFGLMGHSDADVLVHAIIDAICGAASFEDIGQLFPDNDEKYKNISSIVLLENISNKLKEKNIKIINIDSTIVTELPKIAPYKDEMKINISKSLGIDKSRINIKAKTGEGVGVIGSGEACEAIASVLIYLGEDEK